MVVAIDTSLPFLRDQRVLRGLINSCRLARGKKGVQHAVADYLTSRDRCCFYAFALWRIVATNRGNRVIECGVMSLVLVFAEAIAAKSNAPDWVLESLGVLLLLLLLMCFLTVRLFARECYQGIRRWLGKPS